MLRACSSSTLAHYSLLCVLLNSPQSPPIPVQELVPDSLPLPSVVALEADWAAAICQAGIDALVELPLPLVNPGGRLKFCAGFLGASVVVAAAAAGVGVLELSGTLSTVADAGVVGVEVDDRPAGSVLPDERGNELPVVLVPVAGEALGAILWETSVLRLVSSVLISDNRLSVRVF